MKFFQFISLITYVFISIFTSCKKDEVAESAVHCVDHINYIGNYLLDYSSDDSLNYAAYPSFNREKIFIPSAFTPNNDNINDHFIAIINLKESTSNYQAILTIYYQGLFKHGEFASFKNDYFFNWEFPDEAYTKRLYDVYLVISQNGQELNNFHMQCWALKPDQNGFLPKWSSCLTYDDQFELRYGLIFPTQEKFKP